MLNPIRSLGAFLVGTCLAGGVAHAQLFDDCAPQPSCAVAEPTCAVAEPSCAVGEMPCETTCAPAKPPVRYQVSPAPRVPKMPTTYEVAGKRCAPSDCVSMPCEGLPCESVGCAPVTCKSVGCVGAGCTSDGCTGSGCRHGGGLFGGGWSWAGLGGGDGCRGNGCRGAGCRNGAGGVLGGAISLVSGEVKETYRNTSRRLYYKSFDFHRHLHHPITSPAHHPSYGYHQTCWERFPQDALWCPPCYGQASQAAGLYSEPSPYPTAPAPTTSTPPTVPPAAPPAEIPPAETPPAEPPPADSAPSEMPPFQAPEKLDSAPAGQDPAAAVSPSTSAAMLYAPGK